MCNSKPAKRMISVKRMMGFVPMKWAPPLNELPPSL